MNGQPPTPPPSLPTTKTSGLAIASLVLGILGLVCVLPLIGPILAVILGSIAISRIGKSGGLLTGRGQAMTGIILGVVGIVMIPIMAAMLLPAVSAAREKARQQQCLSNLKGIALSCAMYADAHDGKLPKSLDDLMPTINTTKLFFCPSAKDHQHYSYVFTGVTNKWQDDPAVIILEEIPGNHRSARSALYNDGHVQFIRE